MYRRNQAVRCELPLDLTISGNCGAAFSGRIALPAGVIGYVAADHPNGEGEVYVSFGTIIPGASIWIDPLYLKAVVDKVTEKINSTTITVTLNGVPRVGTDD